MKVVTKIEMSKEEREALEKARDILIEFEGVTDYKDIEAFDNAYLYIDKATLSKTINYLDYVLDTKWDE